jgi:protein SCO1/2
MVSVDPERDQPDILQQYVELFNPGFDGVGGPAEAVDRVSSGYGVFYELEPSAASGAGDYLVDHTASLFGIGPDGALRIIWPPGVTADEIRADIEELL